MNSLSKILGLIIICLVGFFAIQKFSSKKRSKLKNKQAPIAISDSVDVTSPEEVSKAVNETDKLDKADVNSDKPKENQAVPELVDICKSGQTKIIEMCKSKFNLTDIPKTSDKLLEAQSALKVCLQVSSSSGISEDCKKDENKMTKKCRSEVRSLYIKCKKEINFPPPTKYTSKQKLEVSNYQKCIKSEMKKFSKKCIEEEKRLLNKK